MSGWRGELMAGLDFLLGMAGICFLAVMVAALPAHSGHFLHLAATKIVQFAQLDFGASAVSGLPVAQEVSRQLRPTLVLALVGGGMGLLASVPVGLLLSRPRIIRATGPVAALLTAVPVFCVGILGIWVTFRFFGLTVAGPQSAAPFHDDWRDARGTVLPALTVAAAAMAVAQQTIRSTEIALRQEPFRRSLALMGLGAFEIDCRYVLPLVVAGVLQNLREIALATLSGCAIAERLFDRPGAASMMLKSVALRDWNVVAMLLLCFGALVLLAEFCGRLAAEQLQSEEI